MNNIQKHLHAFFSSYIPCMFGKKLQYCRSVSSYPFLLLRRLQNNRFEFTTLVWFVVLRLAFCYSRTCLRNANNNNDESIEIKKKRFTSAAASNSVHLQNIFIAAAKHGKNDALPLLRWRTAHHTCSCCRHGPTQKKTKNLSPAIAA